MYIIIIICYIVHLGLNLYNENKDIKEIREFIKMVEPTGMRSDILTCIQDGKAKNLADVLNHTICNFKINQITKIKFN